MKARALIGFCLLTAVILAFACLGSPNSARQQTLGLSGEQKGNAHIHGKTPSPAPAPR